MFKYHEFILSTTQTEQLLTRTLEMAASVWYHNTNYHRMFILLILTLLTTQLLISYLYTKY